jgi:pimeloyl-ACP methyl ester carboxylesterase
MIIADAMRPVLYFHGFASSPASGKITALRPLLEPRGIELITPDLNVPSFEALDWNAVVAHAWAEAARVQPVALVGSSMGALVALGVVQASGLPLPLVLIAPAFGIARRWKQRVPDTDPVRVFNYARNAMVPIHRAFFEQVSELPDPDAPPARVTIVMGANDETVPIAYVHEVWERWGLGRPSKFIEIPNGDHGLVEHAPLIADAIEEAAG